MVKSASNMNYNFSCVETALRLQGALEEFRSFQSTKVNKMSRIDIGDATVGIFSKNYAGTSLQYILSKKHEGARVVIGCTDNEFYIYIRSHEENKLVIPCDQIVSCTISGTTAILHFKEDFFTDQCTIKFFGKEQVDMFMKKIPPIERPEQEDVVSSDSDFNDSGNAKTLGINNSSHSSEYSEHE